MAFVVEDGTGLSTANAYADVAYVDTYFADTGDTGWTGTTTEKEQAIVQATRYIERRYTYDGTPLTTTQALCFPWVTILVPDAVKQACAEYAKRARAATLMPDPTHDASGARVVRKREKAGIFEEETEYANEGTAQLPAYPAADRLLAPYRLTGLLRA